MSRTKDGTARVAMFKELGIPNIFTLEASFCGADRGKYKDQHFTTEYLMMAGQRLLESLIVFSKIEIKQNIKEIKSSDAPDYKALNVLALEKELTENKKLINMTMGEEGNSSGSDSEPSADNLEEDEMAKIVPMKPKKPVPPKKEPPPKPDPKKKVPPAPPVAIKKPVSPQEKKRPIVTKDFSKSPTKKPFGYNYAFDRLSLRKKKPEMKDAWT